MACHSSVVQCLLGTLVATVRSKKKLMQAANLANVVPILIRTSATPVEIHTAVGGHARQDRALHHSAVKSLYLKTVAAGTAYTQTLGCYTCHSTLNYQPCDVV